MYIRMISFCTLLPPICHISSCFSVLSKNIKVAHLGRLELFLQLPEFANFCVKKAQQEGSLTLTSLILAFLKSLQVFASWFQC